MLGRRAEEALGYARALPVLEELAAATGESVNLGIRSGSDVLVVLDVASDQPLRFSQAPGTRIPLHTSAMGKCLLAFTDDPAAAVVAPARRSPRATERTITSPAALLDELERTRERGWALNDEERNPGVRAVAAPVLGSRRPGHRRGRRAGPGGAAGPASSCPRWPSSSRPRPSGSRPLLAAPA